MQKIEALLFIASSPVSIKELKDALNVSSSEIVSSLADLKLLLESEAHGICVKNLAEGWVLETKPELSELVGNFRNTARIKRISLSKAAIETVTIVAYKQPVSKREIEEIRGVDSSSPISKLLDLGLIKISGRNSSRALIYKTTKKFLEVFGINTLENLPELHEIEDVSDKNNQEIQEDNEIEENEK